MLNEDLIAYLQPVPNRFRPNEWRDVCGAISDIRVEDHRFTLRASLPPGLYRCKLETKAGAFDMTTARMKLVRAPDGQKFDVGPFDLDHFSQVMAIGMARTFVNGRLKGGLWFAMPGPAQIAENRLAADFGFEADGEETELTLELVERDRKRLRWSDVRYLELRKDDRIFSEIHPKSDQHPRVYLNADELTELRKRLPSDPRFQATVARLAPREVRHTGQSPLDVRFSEQCGLDLAAFVYLITGDKTVGRNLRESILAHCRKPTWSPRPDPLLMGGDNDRVIGSSLFYTALAREYVFDLFNEEERGVILAKADEYLRKMYDFTVLQRGYMGCPTPDAHSLGAWAGVGVACMVFFDDLAIARKAMPFFHGLFVQSLKLFPPGGKASWATFYPLHLVRYLAAAHTFGGQRPELDQSPFLDRLGQALLTCFETPNSQELQRGLRTSAHRFLVSFLYRFHPTPGIESIYQAFVEQEKKTAGDVLFSLHDLLYAPVKPAPAAPFPKTPSYHSDTAEITVVSHGKKIIGCQFYSGLKAGNRISFRLLPHNREFVIPMAGIEVSVDHAPVLVDIFSYKQDGSLRNSLCLEDGGVLTEGQYIQGAIGPEISSHVRRCFLNDRFVYGHSVITSTLHPKHGIKSAERIFVMDQRTGAIVLMDFFEGSKPVQFATHLHCSGSVTKLNETTYRLTGGQAMLIAGHDGHGLSNEEKGEIFATILHSDHPHRVDVAEPYWFPPYIYHINAEPDEDFSKARFPRYRRWRLEAQEPADHGLFLVALSGQAGDVGYQDGRVVLPEDGFLYLANTKPVRVDGLECVAESVLVDGQAKKAIVIGASSLAVGGRKLESSIPVDVEVSLDGGKPKGVVYSPASDPGLRSDGFKLTRFQRVENNPLSTFSWSASITG